jgi:hypothetical protein
VAQIDGRLAGTVVGGRQRNACDSSEHNGLHEHVERLLLHSYTQSPGHESKYQVKEMIHTVAPCTVFYGVPHSLSTLTTAVSGTTHVQ